MEQEGTPEGRLYKTWEVSAFNRETGEWETATNHGYAYDEEAEEWAAATPAKITPSRAKPVQRDHRVYFVYGDQQIDYREVIDHETQERQFIPLQDERAMRVARLICKDLQPEEIINLGDSVDFSNLSRYKKDSNHFDHTLGMSLQRMHDWWAELRADNPRAKMVEVSSNHEVRLRDWVLKHMPQMHNVWRAGGS